MKWRIAERRAGDEGKRRTEPRLYVNLPPKFGGTVLAMSTCWVEHRLFTKGVVESLGTKESFRSTRLELLYLSLDSVAIRARVTIDLDARKGGVRVLTILDARFAYIP